MLSDLFVEHMIGEEVGDFDVTAYQCGKFFNLKKEDLLGKWSVFFFYPGDFTFVCPTELEDLAEHYDDFKQLGCEVYAISTDSEFVHKAWQDHSPAIAKVCFPMLSDRTHRLSEMFGVLKLEEGQALRGTFVINPNGEISCYEIHAMGIGRDAESLLRKVEASQFVFEHGDMVCPAKWKPGKETLRPGIDLVGKI